MVTSPDLSRAALVGSNTTAVTGSSVHHGRYWDGGQQARWIEFYRGRSERGGASGRQVGPGTLAHYWHRRRYASRAPGRYGAVSKMSLRAAGGRDWSS
jgi:hypothetical protein